MSRTSLLGSTRLENSWEATGENSRGHAANTVFLQELPQMLISYNPSRLIQFFFPSIVATI